MKKLFTVITSMFLLACTVLNAQQWGTSTLYATSGGTTANLCDTNGTVTKTWTFASTAKTGYSSYLMPGGTLWRTVSSSGTLTGGGMTGRVQKVDWAGTVLWDYTYTSSTYHLHHDICPLPNGNVLLISYDVKTAADVSAAGGTFSGALWSEKVMEVKPTGATTGEVVWEWKLWDHLVQNVNASGANYQSSIVNNPQLMNINYKTSKDWVHMNGIDYNPILDQIVVSSNVLSEWWVIDHSTTTAEAASHTGGKGGRGGDLLYRWGNPANHGATGTAVLNVTHDSHWIPEGVPNAGRLVGFNNKGVSSSKSAVDQITPPINGYTYTIGTPTTYQERHACEGYTSNMGNSQQLPNGNMLVCLATQGKIYEVNPSGTNIWEKTITGSVPQAFRYDDCYIKNPAPATPVITINGAVLQSSAATTYQWYVNGVQIPGATSQNHTPAKNGYYLVRITDQNGCVYMYSKDVNFTSGTGINETDYSNAVNFFPNPALGVVNITSTLYLGSDYQVRVSDALGKILITKNNITSLDVSAFKTGIYFISISSDRIGEVNKKISVIK